MNFVKISLALKLAQGPTIPGFRGGGVCFRVVLGDGAAEVLTVEGVFGGVVVFGASCGGSGTGVVVVVDLEDKKTVVKRFLIRAVVLRRQTRKIS